MVDGLSHTVGLFSTQFLLYDVASKLALMQGCMTVNALKSTKTLPKALRTQALTALTSNFGLVGLVQYAW